MTETQVLVGQRILKERNALNDMLDDNIPAGMAEAATCVFSKRWQHLDGQFVSLIQTRIKIFIEDFAKEKAEALRKELENL